MNCVEAVLSGPWLTENFFLEGGLFGSGRQHFCDTLNPDPRL